MAKRDTTERDEKAVADYQAGRPVKDIIAEAKMSRKTLYELLDAKGTRDRYSLSTASRVRTIQKMREQGLTLAEIGRRLDPPISRQRVSQILNPQGGARHYES